MRVEEHALTQRVLAETTSRRPRTSSAIASRISAPATMMSARFGLEPGERAAALTLGAAISSWTTARTRWRVNSKQL